MTQSRFNYRVAGVVVVDGCVLLHREPSQEFWSLPGGHVDLMEPAQDALRREMFEETGLHAAVGRLIWVIENFFDWEGTPLHEVGLYFEMSLHKHATVFEGKEGEKTLEFRWFGFDELPVLNVQPRVIAARLSNLPSSAEYIVHDGRFER